MLSLRKFNKALHMKMIDPLLIRGEARNLDLAGFYECMTFYIF